MIFHQQKIIQYILIKKTYNYCVIQRLLQTVWKRSSVFTLWILGLIKFQMPQLMYSLGGGGISPTFSWKLVKLQGVLENIDFLG